jgi:hypothetical protein
MRTEQERLANYRTAFLNKVKKWKWDDVEECTYKQRGRKAKVITRPESKPRTKLEQGAFAYNWIK